MTDFEYSTRGARAGAGNPPASRRAAVIVKIGSPAATLPAHCGSLAVWASLCNRITGVRKDAARSSSRSMSKLSSSCPATTLSPGWTWAVNPSPPRPTESIPTWIRTSAPLSARRFTAWQVSGTVTTSAPKGARTTLSVGSIETPSPSTRPLKTGSGLSSRLAHQPPTGARTCRVLSSPILTANLLTRRRTPLPSSRPTLVRPRGA